MLSHEQHGHMRTTFSWGKIRCALFCPVAPTCTHATARRRCAMRQVVAAVGIVGMVVVCFIVPGGTWGQLAKHMATKSPWGPNDEIGTLNMMTDTSRLAILKQIVSGK